MKKILLSSVVLLVILSTVLGFSLAGCKTTTTATTAAETTTAAATTVAETTGTGTTAAADSGSKVEEAYVELAAQTTYHTQKNDQNNWTEQNAKDLFAKYGVTEEEVGTFSKELPKDPAHAEAVIQKVLQRLQELEKTGN